MNLAPLKYSSAVGGKGPIDRLDYYQYNFLNGKSVWEVRGFLLPSLRPSWLPSNVLYSSCDGTGTDKIRANAVFKCISECMERWAYYHCHFEQPSKDFGFDNDSSSNGMAAFPGFIARQARSYALQEAYERWAIDNWWRGFLPSAVIKGFDDFEVVQIHHGGQSKIEVAIVVFYDKFSSQYVYGFSAGKGLKEAVEKSLIEFHRNLRILRGAKDLVNIPNLESLIERRLVYFSTEEGYRLFQAKIQSAPRSILRSPEMVFDGSIRGPWSRYSHVWRCVFRDSFQEKNDRIDYFML